MPWESKTVKEIREAFVKEVCAGIESKASICRKYGISRPTGDKWLRRWEQGDALINQSTVPHNSPGRIGIETEEHIISLRQKHPGLGAKKLKHILEHRGHAMPSASTVNNVLKRHGYISHEASMAAQRIQRFERAKPNELWQADFKGNFLLSDGVRCHPLNIIDDHSRFCLCSDANLNERCEPTKASFTRVFQQYGLPDALLCDNGNPWGTSQSVGYTKFEVWLMQLEVLTIHGRIRHPQTQGKQERFNGSLTRELLKHTVLKDISHAQQELDNYRSFYNEERPHEALNMQTPASQYLYSIRQLPNTVKIWDYGNHETRVVKERGFLTIRGQGYFLSEAFACETVAIIPSEADGILDVFYRNFRVAQVSLHERCIISRKPKMCKACT